MKMYVTSLGTRALGIVDYIWNLSMLKLILGMAKGCRKNSMLYFSDGDVGVSGGKSGNGNTTIKINTNLINYNNYILYYYQYGSEMISMLYSPSFAVSLNSIYCYKFITI